MAREAGIRWWEGAVMSFLTNASAGEYAGIRVILEESGIVSMILVTIVASARYFLMASALSQRLSPDLKLGHRLLIAFDLTDEIFGVEISRPGYLEPVFAYGLFILPLIGWSSGTALGIAVGNILPASVVNALSVALYGMFIAIIIPPARKNKAVALGVLVSFGLSFAFSRIPGLSGLDSGTRTIILTVVITALLALIFPVKDELLNAGIPAQTGEEAEAAP